MTPNGKHVCDRCGTDVGNGGVSEAVVVGDLDPDQRGHVCNLHFCRDRTVDGKAVRGCEHKILSPANLKHYTDTREALRG